MEQKDIQQLIEKLTPFFDSKMKDTAYMVANSTNKEHSKLIGELRIQNTAILSGMEALKDGQADINNHLKQLNGSVAKHADKLSQIDVINAQTTLSQQQFIVALEKLVKSDENNTTFRNKADGSLSTFKWLFGVVSLSQAVMFAKYILHIF